jgi:hypothetical protein
MNLKFPFLNGWMRLYIISVALWACLLSYWLYAAWPSRPDDFSLNNKASLLISNEMDQIREISDPIDSYRSADGFCERVYVKSTDQSSPINKNECLQFMLNPDKKATTANLVTEVRLGYQLKKDKVRDLREAHDAQFWSDLKDLLPSFVVRLISAPLILLACGLLVAWVRRGFKVGAEP